MMIDNIKKILYLFNTNNWRRLVWYLRKRNFYSLFLNAKTLFKSAIGRIDIERLNIFDIIIVFDVVENKKMSFTDVFDIIVPVYNGLEDVRRTIDSILVNTDEKHRLIIVDDCSTDKRVIKYLDDINSQYSHVEIIRNNENYGFVRSVNKAAILTSGHFAIVNSDVEVPPGWLTRLMYPIISMENVASTTPFTNAGSIASFPVMNCDNGLFDELDCNTIDRFFQKVSIEGNFVEIPTGVGFCMGINAQVVDRIGMFDADLFGRGYCEENDWCMRARKLGYRHVLVPNLFVYHKHRGTFSQEEKENALDRNYSLLLSKYPNYQSLVTKFITTDPLKKLRIAMIFLLSTESKSGSEVIFDHNLGGGTLNYRNDYIRKRVANGASIILIIYNYHADTYSAVHYYKESAIEYSIGKISDLFSTLCLIKIDTIFINSLVSFPEINDLLDEILNIKEACKAKLIFLFHDFFSVCPSYNLLNKHGVYCDVPAVENCSDCIACHHGDSFFQNYGFNIVEWRKLWVDFLLRADEIIFFSEASREIFTKAYPQISPEKMVVAPHIVDYLSPVFPVKPMVNVVIGVIGTMHYAKGLEVVKNLAIEIDQSKLPFRIVVVGRTLEKITSKCVTVVGEYERSELPSLVIRHKINVLFVPSIWPETFSYTTEEAIQMRMPVAVFNLGAPAERVKKYQRGLILESDNTIKILEDLDFLARRTT